MSETTQEKKPLSRSEREAIIKGKAAITISIMAALLAINTLVGGSNSSKILNNTISANNLWSWYQAKNVRQVLYETAALQANGSAKIKLDSEAKRMETDKKEIAAKAKILEEERDAAKKKSPFFTYAGSLLQIGIVLTTASILAVTMSLFWAGAAAGAVGALLLANAHWLFFAL
jgi:hypothetical protein